MIIVRIVKTLHWRLRMKNYKHILLATDLHADNKPVIEQAVALAKRNNAKLSVVNVLPHIPYYRARKGTKNTPRSFRPHFGKYPGLKALEAQIDLEADFHLLHGSPKRKIVKLAEELNCDIVVIGSHGRYGVERFIGSTANGVLQRAHCDVLVIRIGQPK